MSDYTIGIIEPSDELRKYYRATIPSMLSALVLTLDNEFDVVEGPEPESFDLVIAEPGDEPCETFVRDLIECFPDARIVIASNRTDILTPAIREHRNVAAITKPFHIEELTELVEAMLDDNWASCSHRAH